MMQVKSSGIKRIAKRAFRLLVAALMILQTLWIPNSALAADSDYAFQGYGAENMSSTTLSYATNNASVSGRNVTISPQAGEGEAVGHVALNEGVNDITASVDLGGLEINFSAVSNIALEGENGGENDVPTITIYFCSTDDIGSAISSVTLTKQDAAAAGNETLSSGAGIPSGTRSIFVSLKGKNKTGDNTVTFSDVSLSIRDAGAPSCSASYNQDWTNQDVTVTITAADSDAGLEGIYVNDLRMTGTSPYIFTVSQNDTSFTAYAMDLADKQSQVVTGTIDHIDKTTPAAPSEVPLSSSNWTNADVFVLMPELGASTGSPERYVYQIGSGAWATMPNGFSITAEGSSTIRVAVEDAAGNRSASAQATAKIDKSAPTISSAEITSGSSSARVDISASEVGSSGLEKFRYAAGTQTADFFTTGGTDIIGSTFTVSVGGDYTIFASDYAGNTTLKQISITTAPTFGPISDVSMSEDTTEHIVLSVSDAESTVGELSIVVSVSDNDILDQVELIQTASEASLNITPIANVSGGPVTISVEVEDPSGQKVSRSFTVTVNAANDDPVATDDEVTLSEDGMVEIDVLHNDADDADLDTLSISDVGLAAHGTTLLVLGKIRYTPNENFVGSDSFTYTISDGNDGTDEATVFITVEQVNDAPTAVADAAATAEDSFVFIGVLDNDFDVDKTEANPDEAVALLSSGDGEHGTTRIVEGLIEYTPDKDFNGTDEFTYQIEDLAGLTSDASVTVTVSPETDAPRFSGLATEYTIDEDVVGHEISFEIFDVETPQDSLMLQAATLDEEMIAQTGIEITGLADENPAVKLLLTPVKNVFGDVNIKLTLGDGFDTVEQTIIIHIINVNDAPRAGSDTRTYTEDAAYVDLSIASLLAKHSDIDGDTIRFDRVVSDPSVGIIQLLEEEAIVRYFPVKDYDGTTSFTYYITDGTATTLATCTLEAIGVNDTPKITVSETPIAGTEDAQIVIPFIIEDNESDPSDLSIIVASGDDSIVTTEGVTIVKNSDGTGEVQIQPEADANGTVNITLTVSDGEAEASDSVDLVLAPAQDAPVAEEDLIYVHYTTRRTFSVLVNDHDVDGDTLSVIPELTTLPGTLTFDEETQTFSYVPAIGENGTSTFTYTITDGHATSSALVTLDVISETHAPVITAIDSRYISEDGTASGIAFSVSDEDIGDTATISIETSNADLLPVSEGNVTVTDLTGGNYTLTLKPAVDQAGSTSVTVTVTDGAALTDSTTFYLYVIGQNDAPVAVDDTFTIDEDNSLELKPIENDLDADGDTLWLSSLTSASHGYIEHTGRNYVYYPYENWSGTETLTYCVSDGRSTDEGTITITVDPVNDAPVAWSDWQTLPNVTGAEYVTIPVLANDYDVDTGDVIHVSKIVTQPSYGTVTINEDGTITYMRNQVSTQSNGADSFQYQIIDRASAEGDYQSATATVYIGVEFHGSLYTYGRYVSCFEDDDAFTFDLSVSNPDGIDYTLTVNTLTTLGVFEVVDNDTVRFTPALNQYGYAYITYTVAQDGGGASDTGTIRLRVYPVNDLPEITYAPASITMDEDTSAGYTFDVDFHDEDCSNTDLYFYVYTQSAQTTAPIPFMASYSVSETTGGRQVTIKTAQNVNGTGKIIVGVSDGMTYDEATIDLTVSPLDDAPVVKNVNKTIREDSAVTFASPGSDSEVDGEAIAEMIDPDNTPQHGTATINANRTITYVPDADFFGVDTFNVIVTDETTNARSTSATVTITVNPVNDAPEILDLGYYQTMLEDDTKDVTLTVLDVDNDMTASTHYTLTSSDQKLVKNESITIRSLDGHMVIHVVPEKNAYGTLKISILASDGSLSAKGAFSLTIVPVNDPPEVSDDTAEVAEVTSTGTEAIPPKTTATINLLANDTDVEDGQPRIVAITNIPVGVTVTNKGSGNVLVTVDGDFSGIVTFNYSVMDRAGAYGYGDVTLTVNAVNDPPRAKNESVTISEDETKLIDVLSNDSDPEGNLLTIDGVGEAAHGTAEISGTKVSYTPEDDYYGTDSFTYTISDGNGGTATATVSVTIKPINDYPTVGKHSSNADAWVMMEDEPKSFHFVVADAESATSNLIIKITSGNQALVKNAQIALSTNADGYKTIQITPVANAYGDLTLTLWVSDGLLSAQAVIPLSILSVNDAPVVTAPAQTTKEDTSLTASATATDADGDPVKFALLDDEAPLHGTVTVREDGSYDYMPALDFNGIDHFTIVADDKQPSNNLGYAIVYINVKPDGDAPIAQDDTITINEDIATTIPVLDNDTDQDLDNGDKITILRATTPAHGTTEITEEGILYTPKSDYNGEDSFQYTITDKDGKLDTASVNITIDPVNDVPRDGDDTATVLEDHSVDIDVTINDDVDETTNPDDEDVIVEFVEQPSHGTVSVSTDNKIITYTPDADWFSPEGEPDVFYYVAKDSANQVQTFAVSVTVTSVNDLPIITPETLAEVSTAEDTLSSAITFQVSDIETAAGSLRVTAAHLNGVLLPSLTVTPDAEGNCSFTVQPYANKVGNTTITVTVTDADGGEDTASFLFRVTGVNDAPKPGDDSFTVSENGTYTADVLLNDDVDTASGNGGDTLTLLTIEEPAYGTATIANNKLYYVPDANRDTSADYQVVFHYTMKDLSGTECTPKVTVTVTPVNDAPKISAIADVTGVQEDAPNGTGDVSFSVTDEEDNDDTLTVSIECDNTTLFPLSNITITNPTGDETGSLRTVKAIPAANQFGTAKITLTVHDGLHATASTSFDVTVDSVNDVPLNGDKSFTVVEDVETQLDVLEDIDPDYATTPEYITITDIALDPSHGTVQIAEDGKSIYYTTAQDSNVADMFRYTIHDSYNDANYTFTVDIEVTPVNDAPVVHYSGPAEYTVYQGTPQENIPFTVTDVDNVTFADGTEDVEVTLSAKSSNSILLYNGIHIDTLEGDNRDIDLTPYLKWNGSTTVTITATDPDGAKGTAFFKFIVNNVNDVPVAMDDTGTIPEDQTSTIYVLTNDTDDDLQTNRDTEFIKINTVTDADSNATITKSADGLSVSVVPKANYNGPVSFTYDIIDSFGAVSDPATVNLTVSQVNDAPVTQTDTTTTNEETSIDIDVLANDTDIDKDEDLNASPEDESLSIVLLTDKSTHGTISINGAKITYTPTLNYNGSDTFEYYCSDGDTTTVGTVSLTVYQVNDAPTTLANTANTNEDTPTALVDVLTNDSDVDTAVADNKDVLHYKTEFSIVSATVANAAHGTVEIISNKLKFTPATNWNGSAVVNYTMSDGHGGQSTNKLTVTVIAVNDPPVFDTAPEDLSLSEDGVNGATTVDVSDIETAAGSLVVTATNSTNPTLVDTTDVVVTGTGATRTITVNPKDNQNGTATITLTVSDGDKTDTEEFIVTVTSVNDDPVATNQTPKIDEDADVQTYFKTSLTSDVDIATNGDSIKLTITKGATHGTAAIDVNGNVTYIPTADFNGQDSFEYTAEDDAHAKSVGTFTITIGQVNDAPTVENDSMTTDEDKAVDILALTNDDDIDKDELLNASPALESISIVIGEEGLIAPSHGAIASDGAKITYTPSTNYNGTDTFEYYCSDGDTRTKASVTVTVNAINDDPIATNQTPEIDEDADLQIYTKASLTSDVDIATNDDSVTLTITKGASHGTAAIDVNGNVTYVPTANFNGQDSFEYTAEDEAHAKSVGTFTITIGQVNDAPTPGDDAKTTSEDTAVDILVLTNDTDIDKDELLNAIPGDESLSVVIDEEGLKAPSQGDITTDGTKITYTPDDNYNGTDTFEYYCSDGDELITASVTVTITQVDDDPAGTPDEVTIDEDSATGYIDVLVNDTDVDLDETLNLGTLHSRDTFSITSARVMGDPCGTVEVLNNKVKFTPFTDWNGIATIFYTFDDGYGLFTTTSLRVNVTSINDLPEYTTAPIDLNLTEDVDVGSFEITVTDVETAKDELTVTVTDSSNPTLIATTDVTVESGANGLRTITVNPKQNQNGTAVIELTLTDKNGGVTTEEFTVTVTAVNDDPIAINQDLEIDEDAELMTFEKTVLSSDVDIATNDDSIKLTITKGASHGTATIDVDGNVTYVPTANYNGLDSFEYTATDEEFATDIGTFSFIIGQVNDAPTPDNDVEKTTKEDTAVDILVLTNDTDIDQDEELNASPEDETLSVVIDAEGLTLPLHGDIETDGTKITYTPDDNYNGPDTFEYYCSDDTVMTKATVEITITQVNDSPAGTIDETTTQEDTPTDWIDVMANDTDVDLNPDLNKDNLHLRSDFFVRWATIQGDSGGTVELVNNLVRFTPAKNWFGTAVVHYCLDDKKGGSSITALVIEVEMLNDPPEFTTEPIDLELVEDGNDGEMDIVVGDPETAKDELVVTVTKTSNPTLIDLTDVTVESDENGLRTITVNPKQDQNGIAVIELTLTDKNGGVTTDEFTVTVLPDNDAPVAIDKALEIDEDADLMTFEKALLASDVDIATNDDSITLTITKGATHGTAAIDVNGNVTYVPYANYNGLDSFEYTATDEAVATDIGTFSFIIGQVNDAPTAENDAKTTNEDTAVDIFVLTNDDDIDKHEGINVSPGDELLSVVVGVEGLSAPLHGDITTDGTKITYTPDDNYNGKDTFEYYCSDDTVMTKAAVEVTIKQVNDNPIANDDSTGTDEDTAVSVDVLENDTDVDTLSELNQDALYDKADFSIDSISLYGEENGSAEIEGASIRFTPDANFYGTQVIKYVLKDGNGGTSTGTLTILVGSEFDSPDAKDDVMSADEDHTASVNVLTNDTDNDPGDTKTFVTFTELPSVLEGTFDTDANGDVSFTPNENYNGSFEATYQVRDSVGLLDTAKLTVTITPVNDVPVANDGTAETDEDNSKDIDVSSLIGDVDILTNEDVITVSVAESGEPMHGTVQVSGTTITYTPDKDFNGADEITYTVTDAQGESDTGKLAITINAVNDAPIAVDDTKTLAEDTATEILVRANDTDIDTDVDLNLAPADAPVIWSAGDGLHGVVATDGNTIIYTPHKNYNGTDTIMYVLTDGIEIVTASVQLTITQVNDEIIAVDDTAETNDEDPVTVDVLANDTDVDTDAARNEDELHERSSFRITAVGEPENGTASIVSGKIEYTPDDRFAGTDSFTYTVSDGHGETATGTVTITVHSVNDPPVILAVTSPKDGDRAGTGSTVLVEWTSFDIDGDALTYRLEYFDGKDWLLVSDVLTETKHLFAIPSSLGSVDGLKFRVNASDSEFTSDYGYSGAMKVDQDAPVGTIVTMKTADGRAYTAGTWTNQTVTVIASNSVDDSKVVYYYGMDAKVNLQTNDAGTTTRAIGIHTLGNNVTAVASGTLVPADSMDVVAGVHYVHITAVDEYGNATYVGSYLARVDKQQPAVPDIRESISGGSVVLTLTMNADPGNSGNDKLTLPDNSIVKATGNPTYSTPKNGTYSFSLVDVAGNRRTFTYSVTTADTSKPVITLDAGDYRIGSEKLGSIKATLSFTDAESEITSRGYSITTGSTASGAYRTYDGALTLSDPGTYYIHAYAKNAFGLTTYETFGPFIIVAPEAPADTTPSPTPEPTTGDVIVDKEDIEEVPGDTVSIRIPGHEWSETLTLEGVGPGTYLIEAMDADGNIRTVEVRVTMRDIIARSLRSNADKVTIAAIAVCVTAICAILLLALLAGHNITIVVNGSQKKLRTLRRIKFKKKELAIDLNEKQLAGGTVCSITIAKSLSKNMRGNTVVVMMRGFEVLREQIPENFDEAFKRTIRIAD